MSCRIRPSGSGSNGRPVPPSGSPRFGAPSKPIQPGVLVGLSISMAVSPATWTSKAVVDVSSTQDSSDVSPTSGVCHARLVSRLLLPLRTDATKTAVKQRFSTCRRGDLNAPSQRHHSPRSFGFSFGQPVLPDRRVSPVATCTAPWRRQPPQLGQRPFCPVDSGGLLDDRPDQVVLEDV